MKIHVKLFANFREVTRAKDVNLNVQGDTVRAAIDALVLAHPGLGPLMLHEGKVKPYVNVLLNGQTVKDTSTHIKDDDELSTFPARLRWLKSTKFGEGTMKPNKSHKVMFHTKITSDTKITKMFWL